MEDELFESGRASNFGKRRKTQQTNKPRFKQVKNADELFNIAIYHLSIKDYLIGELRGKLARNVVEYDGDGDSLLDGVISRLKELRYVREDHEFAERFAESSFSNEYGAGYVRTQLTKRGMRRDAVDAVIEEVLTMYDFDFYKSAENRLKNRYQSGFDGASLESVKAQLRKWGFNSSESNAALAAHPAGGTLKTKVEIKGLKADLEKEVLKLARKHRGLSFIRMELRKKKIPLDGFEELVGRLELEGSIDFFSSAVARLSKKRYDIKDRKGYSAAYAFLMASGFTSEQAKFALEEARDV